MVAGNAPVLVHNLGCLNLPENGPLGQQIAKVVNYWDKAKKTPPGVMKGGAPGHAPGVFLNNGKLLPKKPKGYYTESDVWPTGGVNRGADRLVFGRKGEVYYTGDHYKTFHRVR